MSQLHSTDDEAECLFDQLWLLKHMQNKEHKFFKMFTCLLQICFASTVL